MAASSANCVIFDIHGIPPESLLEPQTHAHAIGAAQRVVESGGRAGYAAAGEGRALVEQVVDASRTPGTAYMFAILRL